MSRAGWGIGRRGEAIVERLAGADRRADAVGLVTRARRRGAAAGHAVAAVAGFAIAIAVSIALPIAPLVSAMLVILPLSAAIAVAELAEGGRADLAELAGLGRLAAGMVVAVASGSPLAGFAVAVLVALDALAGSYRVGLAALAAAAVAAIVAAVVTMPLDPAATPAAIAAVLVVAAATATRLAVLATSLDRDGAAALGRLALAEAADGEGLVVHSGDGSVTAVTAAVERLFGLRAVALLGDGLMRRIAASDRPIYLRALAEALSSGTEVRATVRIEATGTGLTVLAATASRTIDVRLRGDGAGGATAALVNAAGRLSAETEARRLATALDASAAGRARMIATVSHELRTPLNAIIGFADALKTESLSGRGREREYAELIGEAGRHLDAVLTDLLEAARPGDLDGYAPEPIDLGTVVERCRRMMAPAAEAADLVLDAVVPPGLPPAYADPRACRQILINLISNAIKFTEKGGEIVVRLEREGERLRLTVRDTGVGLAAEDVARAGTPFLRLGAPGARPVDGAGLGLSVVKALAALHGGRLDIRSRPGLGTTVAVDLPVAPETEELALGPRLRLDGRSAG